MTDDTITIGRCGTEDYDPGSTHDVQRWTPQGAFIQCDGESVFVPNALIDDGSKLVSRTLDHLGCTHQQLGDRLGGYSARTVRSWLDTGPHGRGVPHAARVLLEQMLEGDAGG